MTRLGKQGSGTLKAVSFLALLTLGLVGGVFYLLLSGRPDGENIDLVIARGTAARSVAKALATNGIIREERLFSIVLRLTDADRRLRAGEFRFKKDMRAIDALHVLYDSEPILHTVTIPEGWRVSQIAKTLAASRLADESRFLTLALSETSAQKYGFKTPHLEGFLFPTTYHFSRVDTEERIIDQMVNQFVRIYEKNYKKEAENKGFSVEKLITLSSIVERETGVAEERRLVASVFLNRLKKRMRLQSDPTTIYGIENFNGNLTKEDLRRYSPYNTYVIFGIPPGPIASPGEASIRAVLDPAETDFLYFVANNRGGHHFSNNYRQHTRNVTNTQVMPFKRATKKTGTSKRR